MSTRMCANHPAKPAASRGLCPACYAAARRGVLPMPPKVHVGRPGIVDVGPIERCEADDEEYIDPDAPRCDICADHESRLLRFNLITRARKADGSPTSRSAGAIDLCARCWQACRRKTGPRRMRRSA